MDQGSAPHHDLVADASTSATASAQQIENNTTPRK